jgi:hypothetical protein
MIIAIMPVFLKPYLQNRFYCRPVTLNGTDLSNHRRRKRCALNIEGHKQLMSAQCLLWMIINGTKVPPGVAHF